MPAQKRSKHFVNIAVTESRLMIVFIGENVPQGISIGLVAIFGIGGTLLHKDLQLQLYIDQDTILLWKSVEG